MKDGFFSPLILTERTWTIDSHFVSVLYRPQRGKVIANFLNFQYALATSYVRFPR